MKRVEGICRCGDDLTVQWASEPTGEDTDTETLACAHCDKLVGCTNTTACKRCKRVNDTDKDASYYGYDDEPVL